MNDIITLEQNIKDVYEIKLKQLYSDLKSKCQSSKYLSFNWKNRQIWDRMNCEDGTYKFDIDSILNQHVKCYEEKY